MKSRFAARREFIRGATSRPEMVCILSKGKALIEKDISHTSVVGIYQGEWMDVVDTVWDASAIAFARAPSGRYVIVGEDGDVAVYLGAGKTASESISPAPTLIRNATTIEGYVYVCGMKRQAYARVDDGRWVDLSAPFPAADETAGFEAIDGYARNEIYAAGWSGEVWEFDGTRWTDRSGLTSLILTSVCCAPDGTVYVGGQQGTLLTGRHDAWQIMQRDDGVEHDIWDVHWFMDRLYVATVSTLYTLQGRSLVPVNFGEAGTPTCFNLTSSGGTLWSIGHNDVASFDGATWRRYD